MKITPSQELVFHKNSAKHRPGIHVVTTEAQTLDQALDIIRRRESNEKRSEAKCGKPQSLRQQISTAKLVARSKAVTVSTGVIKSKNRLALERYNQKRSPRPHPYRDLPENEKPDRARQMFASGSFGLGAYGGREIARLFGVPHEVMAEWLGIEIWAARDFNERMVARKKATA